MTRITGSILITCLLMLVSCKEADNTGQSKRDGKPQVEVSNYPLQYFAERIGGELIEVSFNAPGDGDPAFWEPSDEDVAAFQAADLILLNGATYEKWRDHVSLPESVVVETSAAFADQLIEIQEGVTHSHGSDGEHSHAGIAFTTWLDFNLAKLQAKAVLEAMQKLLPGEDDVLSENYSALVADLVKLDGTMKLAAEGIGETPLFVSHPVYHYLSKAYGLKTEDVLWEPEVVPSEHQLAELSHMRDFHESSWMIWEGEPAAESVAKLKEMGIESLVFDPCGNVPDSGDWMSVMLQNLQNLAVIIP